MPEYQSGFFFQLLSFYANCLWTRLHSLSRTCVNTKVDNKRFIRAAINALNAKYPFRQFKDVLYRYNLENDWYAYQEEACK
ncbi:MAG: hypothetical protein HDR88_07675 [Bacteroides sp.]|nr:hypothetical protein [Bacteroides sp.]